MKFDKFAEWAFYAMLTGFAATGVSSLKDLNKSVSELNTQVAVMIAKDTSTQSRISDLDERLKALEGRKR